MGYSSLCSSIHRNPSYNHTSGRGGERVCKITPHHMAAVWTGERCAQSFDVYGRNASANYCIGVGGEIVGCVDENDRSWCSASGWNDRKAITIEVANSSLGGDWPVSQASWYSLVRLCADICRRYGFRLTYDGTRNGSLTEHRMFASTGCPGPYLHARMGELARQVNALLDSGTAPSAPATGDGSASSSGGKEHTGTGFGGTYRCNCSSLNVRTAPSTSAPVVAEYKSGQTVTLDDWYYIADGYVWGRYTGSSSGEKRYVAVGRATGKPEDDDLLVRNAAESEPETSGDFHGGTYRCNADVLNVRSSPSTSAPVVAQYRRGQTVVLDDWYTVADGYVWARYTGASSGKRRYVAVGPATGKAEANDFLVMA